jgi:hypothetical protein
LDKSERTAMSDKPRDWFSVEAKFNVTNVEQLFEFLRAASLELLEEADIDYDASADPNLKLAQTMLNSIGVKTDAKSR